MKANKIYILIIQVAMFLQCSSLYSHGCCEYPDKKECNCYELGIGEILPRPQAQYWPAFFNPYHYSCRCTCERNHSFFAGYRYSQSMKNDRIARCLFGQEVRGIVGSEAPQNALYNETNWLADDFGLSPLYSGQIFFNPSIKNHMIDLSLRLEFERFAPCLEGLYAQVFTTLVYSRWGLNSRILQQTPAIQNINQTFLTFPPCYMSAHEAAAAKDLETVLNGEYLFGDMQSKWRANKIKVGETLKKVSFSDLHFILGYDFLQEPWYHVGAFLVAVAPIGNRPSPENVFEPIVGNGHHWELGGGLDMHFNLWHCDDMCLQFFLNGYATHLFKNTQFRTFDLQPSKYGCSGVGSRFMLLKEFNNTNNYTGNLINALNYTTREITSSFAIQGEVTGQLALRVCNWTFAAGYNMFARSRETLGQASNPSREFEGKHYGVKGTSGVCSRHWKQGEGLAVDNCPYYATESQARLTNTNPPANGAPTLVDHPTLQEKLKLDPSDPTEGCITWNSPSDATLEPTDVIFAYNSQILQNKSYVAAPEFVGPNAESSSLSTDLDYKEIPSQITHGFFAHIDYEWDTCRCVKPFFGVGGGVEFAHNGQCKACSTNQWNVWVRAGIDF